MTIHTIDLQFQGAVGVISAYLLVSGREMALVETGPASCRTALLAGLEALGVEPHSIGKIFLTHIHLDHSGDAGWWAQRGAQVYVHPLGAPHLIEPSKLIESASRIYGERMDSLWEEILPAPADCVHVLHDEDAVKVGEHTLIAWDTPGHAKHHLAFCCGGDCFTGDVAGVRLDESRYLSVASAPPQFDLPEYLKSVQRLRGGAFTRLHLTHFGTVMDVDWHLAEYERRLTAAPGVDLAHYTEAERTNALALGVDDALWARYELANGTVMSAAGIARYVKLTQGG